MRERFEDICLHFQPVLAHFFLEKFPEPGMWFERRLAYTRSVNIKPTSRNIT